MPSPDGPTPTSTTTYAHPTDGILRRAHRWLTLFGGLYVLLVVLIAIPFFQLHAIYCHFVKWPLFADFAAPEKYGLSAHKTLNLQLNASDGVALGAWFVLSDTYYLAQAPAPGTLTAHVGAALRAHPTVLFLHGNAASRAVPYRVQHAKAWSRMGANVLALDYRGFGDSAGTPSEPGLARDAQAAWAWLRGHGADAERIAVVGHSLGTAVATQLVHEVEREGERPRGLVLLAPFASLRTLVDTYYVLGLFPLMKPLELIPGAQALLKHFLAIKYDTQAIIADIAAPLVIVHAADDWDIPAQHSDTLFDAVLSPHLPALPDAPSKRASDAVWTAAHEARIFRQERREELVHAQDVLGLGHIEEYGAARLVQVRYGGHDPFRQEAVQDTLREYLRLKL